MNCHIDFRQLSVSKRYSNINSASAITHAFLSAQRGLELSELVAVEHDVKLIGNVVKVGIYHLLVKQSHI